MIVNHDKAPGMVTVRHQMYPRQQHHPALLKNSQLTKYLAQSCIITLQLRFGRHDHAGRGYQVVDSNLRANKRIGDLVPFIGTVRRKLRLRIATGCGNLCQPAEMLSRRSFGARSAISQNNDRRKEKLMSVLSFQDRCRQFSNYSAVQQLFCFFVVLSPCSQ